MLHSQPESVQCHGQDGRGQPQPLTTGGDCYKFTPVWSPDSKKILWADRKQRLLYIDVASKQVKEIARSPILEFRAYVWSPDSKWIAFARPEEQGLPRIYIHLLSLENFGRLLERKAGKQQAS